MLVCIQLTLLLLYNTTSFAAANLQAYLSVGLAGKKDLPNSSYTPCQLLQLHPIWWPSFCQSHLMQVYQLGTSNPQMKQVLQLLIAFVL